MTWKNKVKSVRKMSAEERRQFVVTIDFSAEPSLLRWIDSYVKRYKTDRSKLIRAVITEAVERDV